MIKTFNRCAFFTRALILLLLLNALWACGGLDKKSEFSETSPSNPYNPYDASQVEPLTPTIEHLKLDFSSNDLTAWSLRDETNVVSDWKIISGKLHQSNDVGVRKGSTIYDQSYSLGFYIFLDKYLDLADYTFSVDVTPNKDIFVRDSSDAQDIGVMFRYTNNDNYYRLILNGRSSYMRLERKFNGVYKTLATTAQGYVENETYRLQVIVDGGIIRVAINDRAIFSVYDDKLNLGTVALYTQDSAAFDNLLLSGAPLVPLITLGEPLAYTVLPNNTVQATATVLNAPSNSEITIEFGGAPCSSAVESPKGSGQYTASCGSVAAGTYNQSGLALNAYLRDSKNVSLSRDEHLGIGIQGDNYLAMGDSITLGSYDFRAEDNQSSDNRIIGVQGYHAVLNNLLSSNLGIPINIANNGIGGDKTAQTLYRTDSILDRHATTNKVLLMLGTNDVNSRIDVGVYQRNMQSIVNKIQSTGKAVWVAKIPPILPFENERNLSKNSRAMDYNSALDSLIGTNQGPDFFNFFYDDNGTPDDFSDDYDRHSLYFDTLHPNALGQNIMASLWYNALTGNSLDPFYLDRLCNRLDSPDCSATSPTSHKQDFLATNYPMLYADDGANYFEVTAEPSVLEDGIWVQTVNNEFNSRVEDYIYFEVDRPVEVFVIYDAGASSVPNWLRNNFTLENATVRTNNPNAPIMNIYSRNYSAGSVSLGGNLAAGAVGADANFVVVVKEN